MYYKLTTLQNSEMAHQYCLAKHIDTFEAILLNSNHQILKKELIDKIDISIRTDLQKPSPLFSSYHR